MRTWGLRLGMVTGKTPTTIPVRRGHTFAVSVTLANTRVPEAKRYRKVNASARLVAACSFSMPPTAANNDTLGLDTLVSDEMLGRPHRHIRRRPVESTAWSHHRRCPA